MSKNTNFEEALTIFKTPYQKRLGSVEIGVDDVSGIKNSFVIKSPLLRKGNYPKIWHHGGKTKDVIALTHGLTDSPYFPGLNPKYLSRSFGSSPQRSPKA
jgi:hypothetical protein